MTAQIVEISGQKVAILPLADYRRLLDLAEDREDVAAAAAAEQLRAAGEEYLPAELVDRILAGESALKVWRQYRGLTLARLGEQVGMRRSSLSEIESGKTKGKPAMWRALADALDVSVDDILPID